MKVLAVTTVLVAIANARPDVSLLPSGSYLPADHSGYDYPSPTDGNQDDHQKHIYFYAAPDEPTYTHLRINVVPKSQKNTKIIFIKAPHHAGVIPEIIAPPSLAEDKTLVYVLTKKAPTDQSITIPTSLGVNNHKPEVFFIKYNNKVEAEAQVNGGIQGQQVGVNVPDLPNEHAFVSTLDSHGSSGSGYHGGDYGGAGISTHADGGSKHGPAGASGPY
ncbi:hypothetical protein FQR65_LT03446 [Abscondita terminalis]|nr:hypothetical protein FQR65_LT03446 [Abscondita terminalis]